MLFSVEFWGFCALFGQFSQLWGPFFGVPQIIGAALVMRNPKEVRIERCDPMTSLF